MIEELKRTSQALFDGRRRSFYSRVNWIVAEETIRAAFTEIGEHPETLQELGGLHLRTNRDSPSPFAGREFYRPLNILNHLQITAGWRLFGFGHLQVGSNSEQQIETGAEGGAAIWFSQHANGSVVVGISPYNSKHMTMVEADFIIGHHRSSASLTSSVVDKHLKEFFRYCRVASATGDQNFMTHVYIVRLKLKDPRYRWGVIKKVLKVIVPPVAYALTTVVTLYAGGKL